MRSLMQRRQFGDYGLASGGANRGKPCGTRLRLSAVELLWRLAREREAGELLVQNGRLSRYVGYRFAREGVRYDDDQLKVEA